MRTLTRLVITAALVSSVALMGAADSTSAAPKATCSGATGVVSFVSGLQAELNRGQTGSYTATALNCTSPIVATAHLSATFGGLYGNCKNIRGDTGTGRPITVTWEQPSMLASSTGVARLTVASTNGHTTTFSFSGTFNQTQGMLYRGQHFSGTITTDRGLNLVPIGDCTLTSRLSSFNATATSLTVGS
jgi:hypothetical protein